MPAASASAAGTRRRWRRGRGCRRSRRPRRRCRAAPAASGPPAAAPRRSGWPSRTGRRPIRGRRRPRPRPRATISAQHRALLVEPRCALEHLADVPVGGVQELHAALRSEGAVVVRTGRVVAGRAAAANGSARTRRPERRPAPAGRPGLGRPGRPGRERELHRQRHRDVRLADEHRARLGDRGALALGRRQEAVLRSGRLGGSSRPTTLIGELAMIRRSTSLAVCWAPIRMMPSERPRSAMSSSSSLIGRCLRAARTCSARRARRTAAAWPVPAFSLRSNSVLSDHADHEALRPVGQVVQVDDGHLRALGGVDRRAGGCVGRSPRISRAGRAR